MFFEGVGLNALILTLKIILINFSLSSMDKIFFLLIIFFPFYCGKTKRGNRGRKERWLTHRIATHQKSPRIYFATP
jgi:hypothetical protein